MKKAILNIMATTGITLEVLAIVGLCFDATVICISAVIQALCLNVIIYMGLSILGYFEIQYPIIETGIKLAYVLILALVGGWLFKWYENMPVVVLIVMTVIIFSISVCLDMIKLREQVKEVNDLIFQEKKENNL